MRILTSALHYTVGVSYLGVALLCALDGLRARRAGGEAELFLFSTLLGLVMLACGAHHVEHATYLLADSHRAGGGDLWSVAIAVAPTLVWVYLRAERIHSDLPDRGDRIIAEHPVWIRTATSLLIAASAFFAGFSVARTLEAAHDAQESVWELGVWHEWLPHLVTAAAFFVVSSRLWRQARDDYRTRRYWSLSGLALSAVFFTGAVVRFIHGTNVMRGFYPPDFYIPGAHWVSAIVALCWVGWIEYMARSIRREHDATD